MKKEKYYKELENIDLMNQRINLLTNLRELKSDSGEQLFNDEWLVTNVLKMEIPKTKVKK